jgi:uncharacterized protein
MGAPRVRKIFDPVHGFILLNDLESAMVDTEPFQRLRYIRQLGGAYLVYPGATHTRFEHSLGTMELATRIFDRIVLVEDSGSWLPDPPYARQIVRFAALCHDLGHLPFSHLAEHLVLGKEGHERWTVSIVQSALLNPIWQELKNRFPGYDVEADLIKLAVGEAKLGQLGIDVDFAKWHQALGQIIAGDFFGADRIDYLLRDARFTGVSYGMFDYHQLIEMVRILPSLDNERLEMGIEEGAIEACEALLLARHFMHRRVYQYDSVKSNAFHIARFIAAVLGDSFAEASLNEYLSWTDNEILTLMRDARGDPRATGYEEAVCINDRSKRFRALKTQDVPLELLKEIAAGVPEGRLFWESAHKKPGREQTFPVLRRRGEIVDSTNVLQITLPSHPTTWVYVDPRFSKGVEAKLSQYI